MFRTYSSKELKRRKKIFWRRNHCRNKYENFRDIDGVVGWFRSRRARKRTEGLSYPLKVAQRLKARSRVSFSRRSWLSTRSVKELLCSTSGTRSFHFGARDPKETSEGGTKIMEVRAAGTNKGAEVSSANRRFCFARRKKCEHVRGCSSRGNPIDSVSPIHRGRVNSGEHGKFV